LSSEPQPTGVFELFYSYSHKDEELRDELETHLSLLKRQGVIKGWHDRAIEAGDGWREAINTHLNTAHIILLLISADFIASDYCYSIEMVRAMERHEAGEARVIPVILRPCDWESASFGELQALPKNALAVTTWANRDEAFRSIAKGIRKVVEKMQETGGGKSARLSPIPRPPVVGFVARRDEQGRNIVERLKEELAPQGNQLVTLSGPGGVGKTTLAAEAARALKEVFGGRIVWSKAEGRADFALSTLLDDIATQLGHEGLRTLAPDLKEAKVRELVADPPILIVLDNFETLAPDAKKGIGEWFTLAQCATLLTSRHPINLTRNIYVAAMSPEEAQEYLEKLIAQTQDTQIFSNEVRQRIYETAEANPYVMQWVVAQINAAQEPRAVLEELAHGTGDAAERVFDRSFNLEQLGDDGRAVLLALSLFAPSATRDALAAVAGFGDDLQRVREAVKNLRALWLIKGIDENRRFTIEGLTRSLARARLLKDEHAAEFRQRFVAHFLSYAEAHAQLTPEDYDALEAEKANVLNATDVAIDLKDWESVQRISYVLADPAGMLGVRGYWDEAIKRNEQARGAAQAMNQEHEIAIYSHRAGIIRQLRGEYDAARIANEEALAIYRKLNQEANEAAALFQLGRLAQDQGEIEEARQLYNQSLEINKRLGDESGIAKTSGQLGRLAQDQGEIEEARQLYNQSLEINKRLGDQHGIGITLGQLGLLAEQEGNKAESVRLLRTALVIFEKLKSPYAETARWSLERAESEES
jgi:tetratricopeptide (TPR) repeat protein/energy-coupling factor transporter ATP-binding protein EcfA2